MKRFLCLLVCVLSVGTLFAQPGVLDTTFNPGSGANNAITAIVRQTDGKIVIGGNFLSYNGNTLARRIGRVHTDGSIDTTFIPGSGVGPSGSGLFAAMDIQPDGKIVIGGNFTMYNGTLRYRVARIHPDGSLDTVFNPQQGVSGQLLDLLIQPDGNILAGGVISGYNGNYSVGNDIIRLNNTAALDNSFSNITGASTMVRCIALQPDGKILIGGNFTSYDGVPVTRIARLNTDGTLDNSFNPGSGANDIINTIVLQPDGKILIGGNFYTYNGTTVNRLARLNSDGSLDNSFSSGSGMESQVYAMAVQPDGRILVGGMFITYNGDTTHTFIRILSDGSRDLSFNPGGYGANNTVTSILIEPGAQTAVIAGYFQSYNGVSRNRIARVFLEQVCTSVLGTDTVNTCGSSYTWTDGKTYTSSNYTATDTIPGGAWNGCDSIVRLHLTLHPYPDLSVPAAIGSCGSADLDTAGVTDAASTGAVYTWYTDAACTQAVTAPNNVTSAGTYYVVGTAAGCSDTAGLSVSIQVPLNPAVVVSTNAQSVCEGSMVVYTALTINAGTAPVFAWYKNGIPVGTDTVVYSDHTIQSSDEVYVQLIPAESCVVSDTVESIHIIIDVDPVLVPSVSISAMPGFPVNPGDPVTFTALAQNGGAAPVFTWLKNGVPIPGAPHTDTYVSSTLQDNDVISCILDSDTLCAQPDTALSNTIQVTVSAPGTGIAPAGGISLARVYPNPASDVLRLFLQSSLSLGQVQVQIIDISGRVMWQRNEFVTAGSQQLSFDISALPAGMYHLQLLTGKEVLTMHKVLVLR